VSDLEILDITIPGTPTSKGRARISARGGFARAYTPAKTRAAEDSLAGRCLALLQARDDRASWPSANALSVCFTFTVPIPASWPAWRRALALSGAAVPACKPDLDNLMKLAKDALNEVLWVDDAQIVGVVATKCYGDRPSTRVVVRTVSNQTTRGAP